MLGDKDHLTYLGTKNQRDGDSSKEILSAPAMDLKVLSELRNFLLEHVCMSFPVCNLCMCDLRPTEDE